MDSVHEANGVCHTCFLMKREAEHQCKDSFNSHSLKYCSFEVRYYLLHNSCTFQKNPENAGDSMRFPDSWCYRDSCIFKFFRQEPCLQQVLFLPQEVLHLSHSQEQHLGWWVSSVTLLSFLHPEPDSHCINLQPPAGTGVPMMPQQPVMYGQPMMRPPFGAATGPGVQVSVTSRWMFNCSLFL